MRLSGKLSGSVRTLRDRLARARYFRGHGVHSPFVYTLVREVFMRGDLRPGDRTLYEALRAEGLPQRRAVQLQNLALRCGYTSFGMNRAEGDLCIVTQETPPATVLELVHAAAEARRTVALIAPCANRERQALCRSIVAAHRSTTVDNRAYLLLFNNHLPKQHFRL